MPAFGCGAIVSPKNLAKQVEGCIIMGVGGALSEVIGFESGQITNPRFSRDAVLRFMDVPPIETVLLDRRGLASLGAGETPIISITPAIANAVFEAIGVSVKTIPVLPEALQG